MQVEYGLVGLVRSIVESDPRPAPGSLSIGWGREGQPDVRLELKTNPPRIFAGTPQELIQAIIALKWPVPPL